MLGVLGDEGNFADAQTVAVAAEVSCGVEEGMMMVSVMMMRDA